MHRPPSDVARALQRLSTNRRVIAKAGALMTALAAFDFTSGDAQDDAFDGLTRGADWYAPDDPDAVVTASADGFVTIVADFSFTAVGASWDGDIGVWPLVEIQVSYDGVTFTELVVLPADVDTEGIERDGRTFTRLLFTTGESIIRYRTTDQNGVPVAVTEFGLTYIDASAGPSLADVATVSAAGITTPPAIISRAGWGADESLRFASGVEIFPRQYATVQHALVHHSETPNDADPLQQMRSIYYFHAVTRGWGDIGYNYLVDKYGNVYEGRFGGQNVIGNHSRAYNVGAAGVCLIGNHQLAAPTQAGVSGLVGLLAWICRGLDPLGFSDSWDLYNLPTISSHRDVTGVPCPGDYAYNLLPSIRTGVASTIASSPASPEGGFVVGDLVSVATGDGIPVNLRASAGLGSQVITQLGDGVLGSVTGNPALADGINWYPITTSAGKGWIDPRYLEFQPAPLVSGAKFAIWDVVSANRSTVALLDAPVPSAPVVRTVSRGTLYRVHAGPRFRGGKVWYHLYLERTEDNDGAWGDQEDFALSSAPASPDLPSVGNTVTTTDSANFRSAPTLSSSIIRTLSRGTEGTVISGPRAANAYNWFQLQTAFGQGWVVADLLRVSGASTPTPTPVPSKFKVGDSVANPSTLNLRSQPTTASSILATMPAGTAGTVLAGPTSANGYAWYQIRTSFGTGWAAGELLKLSTVQPTPSPNSTQPPAGGISIGSTVRTTVSLNLRSSASTSGTVLAVLPAGTSGSIVAGPATASGLQWYQMQTTFGTGWAAARYLVVSTVPTGIQIGSTVRSTSGLRLRSTPTSSGAIITTMPAGTTATVIAGPTSANGYQWWQLRTSFGDGWAAGAYLALV